MPFTTTAYQVHLLYFVRLLEEIALFLPEIPTTEPHSSDFQKNIMEIDVLFKKALGHQKNANNMEMILCCHEILSRSPNHADAWHLLGIASLLQRDYRKAQDQFEKAISLCSTKAIYYNNYSIVLKELGCYKDTKNALLQAIKLNPGYADAWSNLGYVMMALGERSSNIEKAFTRALALNPHHKDALSHLSEYLYRQKRYQNCIELLQRLLALQPHDTLSIHRIVDCYAQIKNFEMAEELMKNAALLSPNHAGTQYRYGILLGETGNIKAAKRHLRKAALLSGKEKSWRWRHLSYCPVFFESSDQIDEYWDNLDRELDEAIAEEHIYNWRNLVRNGFTPSFHLTHHNRCCRQIKEKFGRLFGKSFPFSPKEYSPKMKSGKTRVGFFITPGNEGGFLRSTEKIINRLDPARFSIILFYDKTKSDSYHSFKLHDHIFHIPFEGDFPETVKTVHEANCDILYHWKIGTDPLSYFMPMTYPAPVQCTSWGTHGTTGLKHIDHVLSYQLAEIPCSSDHYTEHLFLLTEPVSYQSRIPFPLPLSRNDLGLPEQGSLYFCPHRLSKYHPVFDFYLKDILEGDPSGHFLILLNGFSPTTDKFKVRMYNSIGDKNFRRIIFLPELSVELYQQYLAVSTVVLDSPVYAGGLTFYDSLSFGIPTITQTGNLQVQRCPTAAYQAMGIKGLATTSQEEYVQQATSVGRNPDYRKYLCEQLLRQSHCVFDRKSVVSEWERFLDTIVTRE